LILNPDSNSLRKYYPAKSKPGRVEKIPLSVSILNLSLQDSAGCRDECGPGHRPHMPYTKWGFRGFHRQNHQGLSPSTCLKNDGIQHLFREEREKGVDPDSCRHVTCPLTNLFIFSSYPSSWLSSWPFLLP
jgi:hypothetical protein